MSTQLTKLALINTSTLSETQTFSVVQDGALDASRQVITIEPNTVLIENERELIHSKVYNVLISGLYSSTAQQTQLRTWVESETNLVFAGFGLDGSILQAEGIITMARGFENRLSFRISSPREAKGGYDTVTGEHTSSMSYTKNGFSLYKWLGVGSPSRAANWTTGGTTISSDSLFDSSNDKQRLKNTTATSNTATFTHKVYFPFPGEQLTAFVEVTDATDVDPTGNTMTLTAKDNGGNTEGSPASVSVDSTGVKLATLTLPADTHHVEVAFNIKGGVDIKIKQPSLQITSGTAVEADRDFQEFNT